MEDDKVYKKPSVSTGELLDIEFLHVVLRHMLTVLFATCLRTQEKEVYKKFIFWLQETHKLSNHFLPLAFQFIYHWPYNRGEDHTLRKIFVRNFREITLCSNEIAFYRGCSNLLYDACESKLLTLFLKAQFSKSIPKVDLAMHQFKLMARFILVISSGLLSVTKIRRSGMQDLTYKDVAPVWLLLGDCIVKQMEIINKLFPKTKVFQQALSYFIKNDGFMLVMFLPFLWYTKKFPVPEEPLWRINTLNLQLAFLGKVMIAVYQYFCKEHIKKEDAALSCKNYPSFFATMHRDNHPRCALKYLDNKMHTRK